MVAREHWERVYGTRKPTEVSWYQREAALSLSLIRRATADRSAPIIDVGGGEFACDGPTHCSGLEVARFSPPELHAQFGRDFQLRESVREEHHTPSGAVQSFVYCMCRIGGSGAG